MKKIKLFLAILTSTICLGSAHGFQTKYGFNWCPYIGIFTGANYLEGSSFIDLDISPGSFEENNTASNINDLDFLIGGHIGCLFYFDNSIFAYGPEVFIQFSKIQSLLSSSGDTLRFQNKMPRTIGGSFRFGVFCEDYFFYALIGGKGSRINSTVIDTIDNTEVVYEKRCVPGLLYGFGIEKIIFCRHAIRLEFSRTNYKSFKHTFENNGGTVITTDFSPTMNDAKLSYSYMF